MTTTQHTRGPWMVGEGHLWHTDESTGMGYRFKPIEFNGGCLAWVSDDDGDAEGEPNAAVIAASPDLLASLIECLSVVQIQNGNLHADTNAIQERARLAIAKASGAKS